MQLWHWIVLAVAVGTLFALDLFVVPRVMKTRSTRTAVIESCVWIACGLSFAGFIHWSVPGKVTEYLTAYVIEESLSVDNLFVFAATFEYFHIRREFQHRVLLLGILAAVVLRFAFIAGGLALIERLEWVVYVFGAFLIFTGARLGLQALKGQEDASGGENALVRHAAKLLPVDRKYKGKHFWYKSATGLCFTPMFLALIAIESADLMFAVDSVPAVLGVTHDRFVAYSSNIFAILGLRALYSVLAGLMEKMPLIRPALSLILIFVGVKMALSGVLELPRWLPLAVIGVLLGGAIGGSVWINRRRGGSITSGSLGSNT